MVAMPQLFFSNLDIRTVQTLCMIGGIFSTTTDKFLLPTLVLPDYLSIIEKLI